MSHATHRIVQLVAVALGALIGALIASGARAAGGSLDTFVSSYARAWSATSPVPLLSLALDPADLAELVALERWDHLAEASARIQVISDTTSLTGQRVLRLRRTQHDRFRQGTWASADVEEEVVVRRASGRLRIVRYDGVQPGGSQSAQPETWSTARAAERAVVVALDALHANAPERCLAELASLFRAPGDRHLFVRLEEPFVGHRVVEASAYFARAACASQVAAGAQSEGGTAAPQGAIDADLDRAIALEPDHALARLLRARRAIERLAMMPAASVRIELERTLRDLNAVLRVAPALEEAVRLQRLAGAVRAIRRRAAPDDGEAVRMAQELTRSPGRLASEVLSRLGTAERLFAVGPEALAVAAELALVDGRVQEAERLIALLGIRCERCAPYLYLEARAAEHRHERSTALAYYAALVEASPTHRDAIWRYATVGLDPEHGDRGAVLRRLAAASGTLPPAERRRLRMILALAERPRDAAQLLSLVTQRFGEAALPPAVRVAVLDALRRR